MPAKWVYIPKRSRSRERRGKGGRFLTVMQLSHRIKMIWDDNGNKKEWMDFRTVSPEKETFQNMTINY